MSRSTTQKYFFAIAIVSFFILGLKSAEAGTVAFSRFVAGNGLTVEVPFKANTGGRFDPDTVTLRVAEGATAVSFQLTVEGSGFSGVGFCELDWDDDAPGAPVQSVAVPQNGSFATSQVFNVPVSRLWPSTGTEPKTVTYELDVDEEPYDQQGDIERYLKVVFLRTSSGNPGPNPNPNPNPNPKPDADSGGGGGCTAGGGAVLLLLLLGLSPIGGKKRLDAAE